MKSRCHLSPENVFFHSMGCLIINACKFISQNAEIVRTRDPEQLAKCDIVVDVGGEFDPKRHRYDHHQRYSTDRKLQKKKRGLSL